MSDLSQFMVFFSIVSWLGMGGWAFATFLGQPEIDSDSAGILLLFCLVLSPFALAFALVSTGNNKHHQANDDIGE